ncbi:MAG: transcriptional regulator TrmB [Gammaproteobacteria bacterium]|jgi:predicted transcriptional regulator|nr:transcriptional regulator TrmB [Gammaproteobacteria bacterium]
MFEEFAQLGFTDKETQVYLCLLMLGKGNVQQICRQTKISRTSIYSVLNRLMEKQLVSQITEPKGGRQVEHFMPNDPSVLFDHIQHERVSLVDKETVAKRLVSRIASQFGQKIRYQSGRELVQQTLQDFFADLESLGANPDAGCLWIYQSHPFYETYVNYLLPLLAETSLPARLLLSEDMPSDIFAPLTQTTLRHVPNPVVPVTTLFSYADRVLLIVCQPATPHYAFLIKDKTIAEDCQRFLSSLWKNASTNSSNNKAAEEEFA